MLTDFVRANKHKKSRWRPHNTNMIHTHIVKNKNFFFQNANNTVSWTKPVTDVTIENTRLNMYDIVCWSMSGGSTAIYILTKRYKLFMSNNLLLQSGEVLKIKDLMSFFFSLSFSLYWQTWQKILKKSERREFSIRNPVKGFLF